MARRTKRRRGAPPIRETARTTWDGPDMRRSMLDDACLICGEYVSSCTCPDAQEEWEPRWEIDEAAAHAALEAIEAWYAQRGFPRRAWWARRLRVALAADDEAATRQAADALCELDGTFAWSHLARDHLGRAPRRAEGCERW